MGFLVLLFKGKDNTEKGEKIEDKALEEKYKVNYLESNFKKHDGYKKSIEYSKEYNLYRQNYCGCKFSKR